MPVGSASRNLILEPRGSGTRFYVKQNLVFTKQEKYKF